MKTAEDFKNSLKQRFTEIVYQSEDFNAEGCGCGSGCGCQETSEADEFHQDAPGTNSITLSAEKPCCHAGEEDHVCCGNH
jgi:hypothetical protein